MSDGKIVGGFKSVIAFLFGRSTLINVLTLALLAISFLATWRGMNDFVQGITTNVDVVALAMVAAVVLVLTLVMFAALRETIRPHSFIQWLFVAPLYALLFMWSVGFGYGFWWSLLAGQATTQAELSQQVEDVFNQSANVSAALENVSGAVQSASEVSAEQMAIEEARGGSCGENSPPGPGPLYRARSSATQSMERIATDIQEDWLTPMRAQVAELDAVLQGVRNMDSSIPITVRRERFEQASRLTERTARQIEANYQQSGQRFGAELRALSNSLKIEPGQTGFTCYDPRLASQLDYAASVAEQTVAFNVREFSYSEGAEGVSRAIFELWSNVFGALKGLLPDGVSSSPTPAQSSGPGAPGVPPEPSPPSGGSDEGRSLIAVIAATGVDLALLVFAILNPPAKPQVGGRSPAERLIEPHPEAVQRTRQLLEQMSGNSKAEIFARIRATLVSQTDSLYFAQPNASLMDPLEMSRHVLVLTVIKNIVAVLTQMHFVEAGFTIRKDGVFTNYRGEEIDINQRRDLRKLLRNSDRREDPERGRTSQKNTKSDEYRAAGKRFYADLRNQLLSSGWPQAACDGEIDLVRISDFKHFATIIAIFAEEDPDGVEAAVAESNQGLEGKQRRRQNGFFRYIRRMLDRPEDDYFHESAPHQNRPAPPPARQIDPPPAQSMFTTPQGPPEPQQTGTPDAKLPPTPPTPEPSSGSMRDLMLAETQPVSLPPLDTPADTPGPTASGDSSSDRVAAMIDSYDDMSYAIRNGQDEAAFKPLIDGLEARLRNANIIRHGAAGDIFNPREHEAVGQVTSNAPRGTIVDVQRAGFRKVDGKLVRPAQVVVSAGPEQEQT